ncbi:MULTISPECIES: hypothetical protein [unclassified Roseateles]|uniref:hypothetical protein n=1 Tax=unclassified Roseateles TaxID=2626991 RepID=UPI0006F670D4|nr:MULTISPECIES: hypothetical protein [unclassified Roseateles]KQW51468.1 hypothetical protein ASC81_02165 [Pelomonas sp. Root405]KRA77701.1 hypothetical protein ASD88_02165 [Pelomonas sp. Root662]
MQPRPKFAIDATAPRFGARVGKIVLFIVVAPLLVACAGKSRLLHPPADTGPMLDWRAEATDGVRLGVQRVIVRNDAASWVREADWDEYALTVRNDGGAPVELRGIELVNDVLGPVSHTTAVDQLKSETTRNVETMKTAGRIVMIGSTGVVAGVVVLATAAGYTLMAPLLPLALIVGGVSAYRSQSLANAEAQVIDYEIKRRGFQLPARVEAGSELRRSAFFPVTPAPQRLRLRYAVGAEQRELQLVLPALAGLHMAPAQK